jgi:hypothetical protein
MNGASQQNAKDTPCGALTFFVFFGSEINPKV